MWTKFYQLLCPCLSNRRKDRETSMTYVNEAFQLDQDYLTGVGVPLGLENPLILSRVFDFLPALDLFSCRLVSHQWKAEASKILRKKGDPIWLNAEDISLFNKIMKNSDNPYSRYALNFLEMSSSSLNFRGFLEHFKVTMLIIRLYEQDVPSLVSHLKYAQKLEMMILIITKSDSTTRDYQKQVELCQSKMSKFKNDLKLPHLIEVRFIINGQSSIDPCITEILNSSRIKIVDFKKWHSSLENILRFGDFEHTHQLILNTVTNSQLQVLCSKLLQKLNYLELSMTTDVEDSTLFDIFKKTSTTLETLQVSHKGLHSAFYFPHPMLNLKTIILKNWLGPILIDSIILNCLKLEKLDFENLIPDNIVVQLTHQSSDMLKHDGLTRLGLLYEDNYPKRKIKGALKRLLPKFPNVKDFYSAAETDDILELILKSINVEMNSIYVDFSLEISDASVTGIPLDLLEVTDVEDAEHLECGCWVLKYPKVHRKNPYIGDLTKLQQLHISIERGSQISNLSIHHGIVDLKSLQILRLYSKGIRWCLKAIADNLSNLQRLYLKSPRLYRDEELTYIMDKIPGLFIEFTTDSDSS